jgi:hypothetical protein
MAVQLAFLRHPGRGVQPGESPPNELLNFLAAQLKADGTVWAQYAEREETGANICGSYSCTSN